MKTFFCLSLGLLFICGAVFATDTPPTTQQPITVQTSPNVTLVPSANDTRTIEDLFKDSEYKKLTPYKTKLPSFLTTDEH